MVSNLVELSRRVSEAEGPSRELDGEIAKAFGWHAVQMPDMPRGGVITTWVPPRGTSGTPNSFPRYTASLDTVAAFTAEKLPDWDGYCDTGPNLTQYKAGMGSPGRALNSPRCDIWATGKTECLARLAAALLAIHERNKSDDKG